MKFVHTVTKVLVLLTASLLIGCAKQENAAPADGVTSVRLGYFPNITHAQALLGVARGDFQKALGDKTKLETFTFNAGPSVIEAVYANKLDIAYIGPSPAINGFIKSKGEEVRVVAGAATNGVLIIGNKNRNITEMSHLRGKKIATPQLGNTQDISAKAFVVNDLKTQLKEKGGDTEVIPVLNPDIETLFQKDQLDAAWVPEPWGSRIVDKGLANIIAEEKDLWPEKSFNLTNIIVRRKFLEQNPELVKSILIAHIQLTKELQADAPKYVDELNAELKKLTTKELPPAVILGALKHTGFTIDPAKNSFTEFFEKGKQLGLLKADSFEVDKLIDTRVLDEIMGEVQKTDTPQPGSGRTDSAP